MSENPEVLRASMAATFRVVDAPLGALNDHDGMPFTPTTIDVRERGGHVYVVANGPCVRKDGTPGSIHRQASYRWGTDPMPAWIIEAIHSTCDFMTGASQ